jgi:ABC-type multidrug transport system ATPase subunit
VGQVAAIVGPSGSGKSSLLNALAGRSASGGNIRISGAVKVGDREINPVQFRRNIAYVMQDDCLLATATPREALRFSASLRLPSHITAMEITDRVEKLIKELGLTDCADIRIGDDLKKGISGGQRKRTSVGVELITEPTVSYKIS